ncbi:MAG: HIT family protein [archaeon]|nr:HIT family protein [archaeon]
MECRFCRIYKDKEGIIYENECFFAQFDCFPVSPGHAEVIPKRHVASLFDLTSEEWEKLQHALSDVVRVIGQTNLRELYRGFIDSPLNEKSTGFCKKMLEHAGIDKKSDGYNIGVNEGEAAGRTIHHLHIHIIPRYFGDVKDCVGGIRHIISGMGNYRKT